MYLVRPDGYVGLADPDASPAVLERFLNEWGLRPERSTMDASFSSPRPVG